MTNRLHVRDEDAGVGEPEGQENKPPVDALAEDAFEVERHECEPDDAANRVEQHAREQRRECLLGINNRLELPGLRQAALHARGWRHGHVRALEG